jgi:hypothetical protein
MQILAIRPETGRGSTLARFDAQVSEHIRMFNMRLVEGPRGRRIYAASALGANSATFAPALADDIKRAASAAYDRAKADIRDDG